MQKEEEEKEERTNQGMDKAIHSLFFITQNRVNINLQCSSKDMRKGDEFKTKTAIEMKGKGEDKKKKTLVLLFRNFQDK